MSWRGVGQLPERFTFRVISDPISVTVSVGEARRLIPAAVEQRRKKARNLQLARVLLVDDEVASRLTLQTLLRAAGYSVDVVACSAEALGKLDQNEYELVLSDLRADAADAGRKVLAYARSKEYRPATALVKSWHNSTSRRSKPGDEQQVSVADREVTSLLSTVAELIGRRARRRSERALRG